ncbi:uncharacterized protein N7482_002520 [Penicillium canariense]|uniref:Beta-lactamase-related domain-containing protein n=1 Tax=Penicillium canariense TaxID=189055 RepID=A0A9W9LTZ7_9EURO|nr:uncharacterized protein N7482_002520 [Penicillium canariense]KAJ5176643.1 hypothetical protein N7482_002520 [Penicillium canariense]
MSAVHGHCDPAFSKVRGLLEQKILSEEELGASLFVNIDGRDVIDVWGGYADRARSKPWTADTIAVVWSTSKCITNLAALLLIDRGLLDPSARVSQYWPEFAANGKENVQVWHVLTHSAGLPAWEKPITIDEVYDVPQANARLAAEALWWTPGTATGYHAITQGHIISELLLRITGKRAKEFIAEELARPLNADFQLGVREQDRSRVAEIISPPPFVPPADFDPNSLGARALTSPLMRAELAESPAFLDAEMSSGNGFGTAKGIARILSTISLGGVVDGQRLLSPETVRLAVTEQIRGTDLVLGKQVRFGMGFGLRVESGMSWIREGSCYWGGWGGSIAIMDVENRITICYVPSRMENAGPTGDARIESYVKAIYEIIGR